MGIKATRIQDIKAQTSALDSNNSTYTFGEDNLYPQITNLVVSRSVTATACYNLLTSFVLGKGFNEDFEVNDKQYLNDFGLYLAQQLAKHRGAYIQVQYDANCELTSFKILPFENCRVGKKDDDNYNGKIAYSKDWTDTNDNPVSYIDVYNPNLVQAQFDAQGGDYKGQIMYINTDFDTVYPKSQFHSVINDAIAEYKVSVFKRVSLESGFFGKELLITKPFADGLGRDTKEYQEKEGDRQKFLNSMKGFVGVENADGFMHLEMEFDSIDDIEKQIIWKSIESNINPEMFKHVEETASNNIRKSAYNVPSILISNSEGQMFSESGDGIKQAKLFYQDQTNYIRSVFIRTINELTKNLKGVKKEVEHKLLIDEVINQQTDNSEV